jgi:hypothetical protein
MISECLVAREGVPGDRPHWLQTAKEKAVVVIPRPWLRDSARADECRVGAPYR